MKRFLLCTSNQLLARSLYTLIREEGCDVEQVEHPAHAVQRILQGPYACLILDAEPFGLSAADAARIAGEVAPGMPVLDLAGAATGDSPATLGLPPDLDAIKGTIHRIAAGFPLDTVAEGRTA